MARLNVYVPDDLAAAARDAGLNISALTQGAIDAALRARRADLWLDSLEADAAWVSHETALAAVDSAKDEFDG